MDPEAVGVLDGEGDAPVLDQDRVLAASDAAAWVPPKTQVPYVSRWTSTHAPSAEAAAKWQSYAQQGKFSEVHMPDSCFVPMEGCLGMSVAMTSMHDSVVKG